MNAFACSCTLHIHAHARPNTVRVGAGDIQYTFRRCIGHCIRKPRDRVLHSSLSYIWFLYWHGPIQLFVYWQPPIQLFLYWPPPIQLFLYWPPPIQLFLYWQPSIQLLAGLPAQYMPIQHQYSVEAALAASWPPPRGLNTCNTRIEGPIHANTAKNGPIHVAIQLIGKTDPSL